MCAPFILLAVIHTVKSQDQNRALELYQSTQYRTSLNILLPIVHKDAAIFELIGKNYLMIGEPKKAIEALSEATTIEPNNSGYADWLGRAYGRKAENGGLTAPSYAIKARQLFEKSVALDPSDKEALSDLFTYYLKAPEMLGGGIKKAEDLAVHIAQIDPAEGHYAQAQIQDKQNNYDSAERQLRLAWKLSPENPTRAIDLAIFLSTRGRFNESEAIFEQVSDMVPNHPRLLFERANVYIQTHRNLEKAKRLLERYIGSQLTPDDQPREQAEVLLKKIGACCL
jgi:Flp pilus assembly protein TadD